MIDQRDTMCGNIKLLDMMGSEVTIVNAARVSYGKRVDLLEEKDEKLLKYLWDNRHTSPFEKVQLMFQVTCPIPISKQWMRHRTWSYNEISRRYTDENIWFYMPRELRLQGMENKQGSEGVLEQENYEMLMELWAEVQDTAQDAYDQLLLHGVAKEQARFILPQSLMTEFYASVNLKNLMDFLRLRMAPDAQEEIRCFAEAIYGMLENRLPLCMEFVWNEMGT